MSDEPEPVTFAPEPPPTEPAGPANPPVTIAPPGAATSGRVAHPSRGPGLRRTIRLLSLALLAYGIVSLALAVGGGVVAWRLGDELRASTATLEEDIDSVQRTLESSAVALSDIADTAEAFAPTLGLVEGPLGSAATTVGAAASTLDALAGTLAAFQVLGLRPFESVAADIADTADGLTSLASDLDDLSATLPDVGDQLDRSVASLRELSIELSTLAEGIGSGRVVDMLQTAVDLVVGLAWILAAWLGLLAAGALLFGSLLWRMQAPRRSSAA
jgi:hypothetical protein